MATAAATPAGCGQQGYASSDIFYLESCMYSMMCSNRDELFRLEATQDFTCQLDHAGYMRMVNYLLHPTG